MLNNTQIKYMVDRFLQWKLPANFSPDGGISFTPIAGTGDIPHRHEPVGTNLFTATQATDMVLHMIDGMPEPLQPYQQRVVTERDELAGKLGKLNEYLGGSAFTLMPPEDQALLRIQAALMGVYLETLEKRIARF